MKKYFAIISMLAMLISCDTEIPRYGGGGDSGGGSSSEEQNSISFNRNPPEKNEEAYITKEISFKGIKFGMKAKEIAELTGGNANTEYGCGSAIKGDENQPWTYGGLDTWMAACVEDDSESSRVPDTSGMYQLRNAVASHNNRLAKFVGRNTYSIDELVEIFSEVFGKFEIETKIFKNGLGQEFLKNTAIATHKDAVIIIADDHSGSDHDGFIKISITNIDYLAKKSELEEKQANKKLNDAKTDF